MRATTDTRISEVEENLTYVLISFKNFQVCGIDFMRRPLQFPGRVGDRVVLDRLFQFVAEPADIRLLQPRLQRSVQEYTAVRVPVLSVVLSERERHDGHELRLIPVGNNNKNNN